MGGWGSLAFGKKKSRSQSESQTSQNVFLANLFSSLFGGAGAAAGDIDTGGITDTANALFSSGSEFISGLQDVGGGEALASNIDALKTDVSAFFNEELLPGITSTAIGGGQLGGGRQGVAQGIAAGKMTDAFSRGVADLRSQDVGHRLAASEMGLGALGQQMGFAQEAAFAPLSPFLALSQIMGDPTVLTESEAWSKSKARGFDFSTAGGGGMGGGGMGG